MTDFMTTEYTIKVVKALATADGKIYDSTEGTINWEYNEVEKDNTFLISDVAVIGGNRLMVINRGTLLIDPTWQELSEYWKIGVENIERAREEFRRARKEA